MKLTLRSVEVLMEIARAGEDGIEIERVPRCIRMRFRRADLIVYGDCPVRPGWKRMWLSEKGALELKRAGR